MILVIGSKAADRHGIKLYREKPTRDIDMIGSFESLQARLSSIKHEIVQAAPVSDSKYVVYLKDKSIIEYEIAWPNTNNAELLNLVKTYGHRIAVVRDGLWHAGKDILYALKMSHRYLRNSPHFHKTMHDIITLRTQYEAEIPDILADWYKRREAETYAYKHPNLDQGKDGFFSGDGVDYKYDHDSIHEAIKFLEKPAYQFYQSKEVLCSKELWDASPDLVKLYGVIEESIVLALERHQIPNGFKPDPRTSFFIALEKVCTSITSGWFREFAWENYKYVEHMYTAHSHGLGHDFYVRRFQDGLRKGIIKPYRK